MNHLFALPLADLANGLFLAQAAKPDQGGLSGLLASPLPLILAVAGLAYLMLFRPDSQKRKEIEQKLANLQKNDPVVTIGGICGIVVNISPNSAVITIRVDDGNNTRLRILRSAVSRIGQPEEDTDSPADSKTKSAGSKK